MILDLIGKNHMLLEKKQTSPGIYYRFKYASQAFLNRFTALRFLIKIVKAPYVGFVNGV